MLSTTSAATSRAPSLPSPSAATPPAIPNLILNFPSEITGYVYSNTLGDVQIINYGKESVTGSAGTFPAKSTGLAIPPTFGHVYSAEESTGQLGIIDNTTGKTYGLNLPNVFQVVVNQGDTVVLAMVRNSEHPLSRHQAQRQHPICDLHRSHCRRHRRSRLRTLQPARLLRRRRSTASIPPLPRAGTFDRPINAYFSLDGNAVYVLNCGPECGGTTSSVTYSAARRAPGQYLHQQHQPAQQNPNAFLANVPVPGGVTAAVSDGTTLYVSGQQLQPDGLFAGNLSTINLATNTVTSVTSISDGHHTKMLFADDNTLWIGSQLCANGERAAAPRNSSQQASPPTRQPTTTASPASPCPQALRLSARRSFRPLRRAHHPCRRPLPQHQSEPVLLRRPHRPLLGSDSHKVYTAYGGQIHAFNTADGSEINNTNITVQGTALDVAYMDAVTDAAN